MPRSKNRQIDMSDEKVVERFLSKIDKENGPVHPTHGRCWVWATGTFQAGYGMFSINHHPYKAHRCSWVYHVGDIPDGICVLHRCDNPQCVRPDHLFLGTLTENVEDRHNKRRDAYGDRNGSRTKPELLKRGSDHGMAKLTEDDVREIRRIYRKGSKTLGTVGLARRYGVRQPCVMKIVHRKTWAHLSD